MVGHTLLSLKIIDIPYDPGTPGAIWLSRQGLPLPWFD